MRQIKSKVILTGKKVRDLAARRNVKPSYLHENVPYFAQWESRELVEGIIKRKIEATDDPRWKESGADNKAEYSLWSWNGCGMACLRMILGTTNHKVIPLVKLGKQCLARDVYQQPLESSPGLFYKPFVTFIEKEFGWKGKASSSLTALEIKRTLSQSGYVIASVTPEIRHPNKKPIRKSGHLVLLLGYDDTNEVFYLHNPSGSDDTQEYCEISYKDFAKFFSNKGILIFT